MGPDDQEKNLSKNNAPPRIRVAMVTNIPAPYRIPVYENLVRHEDIDFCVFFCSGREPDREWDLQGQKYRQVYLKEKFLTYRGRYIHCNPDIWSQLKAFAPQVVVTTGFNPSFILAYLYARWHGARHIAMTDGTYFTESRLTAVHRLVRRWIYSGTSAFLGASQGSFELYRSYGIAPDRMFQSHLCANNDAYAPIEASRKQFDFVFSARFIEDKNPRFAMDVARAVGRRLNRRVRLLMMGSGELDQALRAYATEVADHVDVHFPGFVKQADLPAHYASARLMLFPTAIDTWGVVANEAMAAGVPVLVTPMAGVAGDLVLDGENGRVLPLDLAQWTDAAVSLLSDEGLRQRMATNGQQRVQFFSYVNAAEGIYDAVSCAVRGR